MKKSNMIKCIIFVLSCVMMTQITGCKNANTVNSMDEIVPNEDNLKDTDHQNQNMGYLATDFAVRLLQQKAGEKNEMFSPLSVLYALGMTQNGAEGDTLQQMLQTTGMGKDELNQFLSNYNKNIENNTEFKINKANSIWIKNNGMEVNQEFLQTIADYYQAGVFFTDFNEATKDEINQWVKEQTNKKIDKIVDKININTKMYLINTLTFDADWKSPYENKDVKDDTFITESGKNRAVKMMCKVEYNYLEDDNCTGFLKEYEDTDYAFIALLPNEGISMKDYIKSLTGEKITQLIENKKNENVVTSLPKFDGEYSINMKDCLAGMGMTDAFDIYKADFSGIQKELYIDEILQKTYVAVNENGTRAGAVVSFEFAEKSFSLEPLHTVILNRPFVYLIMNTDTNVPLFIGTVMDIEE